MIEAAELKDLLDRLARRFEDVAQESTEAPCAWGWGQFLDAPKRHKQIGSYGTSAGILVLALAGRGMSVLTTQADALLHYWWMHREQGDYARQRFVQTLRLAFLNLALRLSPAIDADKIRAEVENTLLERLLPSGMWGNYWISDRLQDPTPRLFPSAIVLLSFTLLRDGSLPTNEKVLSVADRLEERLTASRDLPILEAAAVSAAILAAKGTSAGRKTLARMADIARSTHFGLGERNVYYYDYEHSPDIEGQNLFGRDYFIVPIEILIGISGFQPGAPSGLRMRSEAALSALIENLRQNDGAYRPAARERLSSMDQAWSAILLKMSSLEHASPAALARVWYELIRHRKGNRFTNTVLPALSMLFVTAANALMKDAGPYINIITALAILIIGGLYGPPYLRRLILGQE